MVRLEFPPRVFIPLGLLVLLPATPSRARAYDARDTEDRQLRLVLTCAQAAVATFLLDLISYRLDKFAFLFFFVFFPYLRDQE